MPSRDEHGSPLKSRRAANAGKPIAGAFKFLLTQILGDWEWLSDSFSLHQSDYRNDTFCFLCRATKSRGLVKLGVHKQPWLVGHHGYPR